MDAAPVEHHVYLSDHSIESTRQMDILRCKTPDMVHKEIWTHLLAYNLLRTVMAVAADENDTEPRTVSFKKSKQALTAFAPRIEAARPEDRAPLIDAVLTTIAYHRIGDRRGRWEPRTRKQQPKHAAQLTQPRHTAEIPHNRSKWFWAARGINRPRGRFIATSPIVNSTAEVIRVALQAAGHFFADAIEENRPNQFSCCSGYAYCSAIDAIHGFLDSCEAK